MPKPEKDRSWVLADSMARLAEQTAEALRPVDPEAARDFDRQAAEHHDAVDKMRARSR